MAAAGLRVSIVVPTFRRPTALRDTLAALARLEFPADAYEVIVVDDGSDRETQAVVERAAAAMKPAVRYLGLSNAGVATARNRGARLARGDVLIFLDDDMIVEPNHIEEHLRTQELYGPGLVNGHWEFEPRVRSLLEESPFGRFRLEVEEWVKEGIAKRPLRERCVVPSAVTACNLSLSRKTFEELGGFDEDFPFAGSEDLEFSARAADAQLPLVYNRDIALLHNDNRLTLQGFGRRQEQGAVTSVYLASKRPDEYAARPLIYENAPVTRADGPRLAAKKLLKWVLSRGPVLRLAHVAVGVVERVRPETRLLRRAYWGICGLHIYRGVQRGLKLLS